jgi:hypothetical protein
MGFWSSLLGSGSPRASVTVANLGGTSLQSDGSVEVDLPGPVNIDTQGRTSIEVGGGLSIRSDGSVNFNPLSDSFGSFRSSFDP